MNYLSRRNFNKLVGASLSTVALPKISLPKTKTREYLDIYLGDNDYSRIYLDTIESINYDWDASIDYICNYPFPGSIREHIDYKSFTSFEDFLEKTNYINLNQNDSRYYRYVKFPVESQMDIITKVDKEKTLYQLIAYNLHPNEMMDDLRNGRGKVKLVGIYNEFTTV